ncbi:MAG: hypothetical protein U5K79_04570 [Cyclobacteriaceae bacterium]|nr:hypothetical protein [Cyclobacteriaceae bacterium]
MIRTIAILFSLVFVHLNLTAQNPERPVAFQIDSIVITNNWRTRDHIIRNELGFHEGDLITLGTLDTMAMRIWNIGNFAKVEFKIDSTASGTKVLYIHAKDAFTIVPILGFSGNSKDWRLSLGMSDSNFLGRNINFGISGTLGTNGNSFNAHFSVPRQLLYKNMAIHGGLSYGKGAYRRFIDREPVSEVVFTNKQIYWSISSPWNEDFKYRFSPDVGFSLFQHQADSSFSDSDLPFAGNYTINYFTTGVSESIGYIRRVRHQLDGYRASVGVGMGIGLGQNSPFYYSFGGGAEFHKLFNKVVQFSAEFSTGYTSSTIPSLLFYKGANAVKGILTGEISGQSHYSVYTGLYLTYINRDWFAMEQSFYVNWGNGRDVWPELFATTPVYGVGSGIYCNIPMIPWLAFRVFFTYSGKNSNWFNLDI